MESSPQPTPPQRKLTAARLKLEAQITRRMGDIRQTRRFSYIILRCHVAPVEIWLGFQDLFFAGWLFLRGGDATFKATLLYAAQFLPIQTGRAILSVIVVLAIGRIYSCIQDYLFFRRWIARIFAFHWLAVFYVFLAAGTYATELPIYGINILVNGWLQFRLDERYYRARRAGGSATPA